MTTQLRIAESINLIAFSWLTLLAWLRRELDWGRRWKITAIGIAGLAVTAFTALVLPRLVTRPAASMTRDWIPFLLLLMFYWQAGQFVVHTNQRLEQRLAKLDRWVVAPVLQRCARQPIGFWILGYLEFAYLFCYLAVPLGLSALYIMRKGSEVDHFWAILLSATYACYLLVPYLQTWPPRLLTEEWSRRLPSSKMRAFNLWILRHGSIHANTFPSAHAAGSMACALTLLILSPAWVGMVFLWIAISIALGAVAGRYHFAADAILGNLVALAAFLIVSPLIG